VSDFNINEFLSSLDEKDSNEISQVTPKNYASDLYKKWFKTKNNSGFLTIKPWFDGMKIKVDIGKTSNEGKLISSTNVYLDALDFAAYLRSIVTGNATVVYPANERIGIPTEEGFASYGGSDQNGKIISRIFKAHYWQSNEVYDSTFFAWKCGHFNAKKSDTGAFIPDMKSPLSVDSIKVTRQDIAEISYRLDLALTSYVFSNNEWYEHL
jgi:hypothetical protein